MNLAAWQEQKRKTKVEAHGCGESRYVGSTGHDSKCKKQEKMETDDLLC